MFLQYISVCFDQFWQFGHPAGMRPRAPPGRIQKAIEKIISRAHGATLKDKLYY